VIAQTARRGDNDMRAALQRPALVTHVHATHGRGQNSIGLPEEPRQLALDLQGQFARRRDHQGQGRRGWPETLGLAEQARRDGKPESKRLARSGLRRDQKILARQFRGAHGLLHGGERGISLGVQSVCKSLFQRRFTFRMRGGPQAPEGRLRTAKPPRYPFRPWMYRLQSRLWHLAGD
jgi:hypothetical protein